MVELVGIEKLGILKTDKLLICREPYNVHKASNACNAGFIVRLLYGDSRANPLIYTFFLLPSLLLGLARASPAARSPLENQLLARPKWRGVPAAPGHARSKYTKEGSSKGLSGGRQ